MSEPITEIPGHIHSLPLEEQGPALVKAIHDRKAAEQLRAEFNTELREMLNEQYQLGVDAGLRSLASALVAAQEPLPATSRVQPGLALAATIIEAIQKDIEEVKQRGAGPR